jgi:hypothetical protein
MSADRDAFAPGDSGPGVSLRERSGSGLLFEICTGVSPMKPLKKPWKIARTIKKYRKP